MSQIPERNRRVEQLLREAGDRFVTKQEIQRAAGSPVSVHNVMNVLRQLRPGLLIESRRGVGWRLTGEDTSGAPRGPVLADKPRLMMELLETNLGEFVPGREIAHHAGALVDQLSSHATTIRRHRPDLAIDAERGFGFRARKSSEPYTPPIGLAPRSGVAQAARPPMAMHDRMRTVADLLAALAPVTAEQVKNVALESGENIDQALARLVNYGVAVHVDLVISGENPLGLRRQTSGLMHQVAA